MDFVKLTDMLQSKQKESYDSKKHLEYISEKYNASEGEKHLEDGYECDICKNKGFVSVVKEGQLGFYEAMTECKCMKIRRAIKRLDRSGLKDAAKNLTFKNYEASEPWQKKLLSAAIKFAENPEDRWLYFGGCTGSGKTHLCTAVSMKFLRNGKEVYYMLWREDAPQLKSLQVSNMEEYTNRMEQLKTVDVLYIDDLFKIGRAESGARQRPTSADINLAFEILNKRAITGKTTIISSECTDEELVDIDQGLAGRIIHQSRPYFMSLAGKDKDWRLKGTTRL